jgi:nucleotide-binding universal stress UspA family protein
MSSIFSRILVGVDDSEQANVAVTIAARLVREHRGELVLCHCVSLMSATGRSGADGGSIDSGRDDASVKRARAVLDVAAGRAIPFGVAALPRIVGGEAATGIIRVAHETACRLIVVGKHQGVRVQELITGSTTNAVLRASTLPVLTIGRGVSLRDGTRRCFERVLVATDGSEASEAAVETAFRLPSEDRRTLIFCSVTNVDHVSDPESEAPERDEEALGNRLTAQAETIAGRAQGLALARGVAAESLVLEGSPSEALVAAAVREQADLIILGSHGRRGLQRLLLGSVAETVVRTAPLPVLVVPISVSVGITAKTSRQPT